MEPVSSSVNWEMFFNQPVETTQPFVLPKEMSDRAKKDDSEGRVITLNDGQKDYLCMIFHSHKGLGKEFSNWAPSKVTIPELVKMANIPCFDGTIAASEILLMIVKAHIVCGKAKDENIAVVQQMININNDILMPLLDKNGEDLDTWPRNQIDENEPDTKKWTGGLAKLKHLGQSLKGYDATKEAEYHEKASQLLKFKFELPACKAALKKYDLFLEGAPEDRVWGIASSPIPVAEYLKSCEKEGKKPTFAGKNILGKALVNIRNDLRNQEAK